MPEGDTIHRAARQLNLALGGREIGLAEAPNPRSPLHRRAAELQGRTLEHAEARGKHLLVHFSGGVVLHTHLGMNGKVFVVADGRRPYGKPWWTLASGRSIAAQTGAKLLRLTSETRARNDPALIQLGPDPLRPGFDVAETAVRMRRLGAGREIGDSRPRPGRRSPGSATRSVARRSSAPGSAPSAPSTTSPRPSSSWWSPRTRR